MPGLRATPSATVTPASRAELTLPGGIGLAAARKAAGAALYEVDQGRDPGSAKRQAKQAQRLAEENTFEQLREEYLKREGYRLRSAKDRRAALERLVYPTLGDRPIAEIRRSEIIRLLDKIEEGDPLGVKGGPTMADRTLAVVRKIMNWHATRIGRFPLADRARHGAGQGKGTRTRAHLDR